MNEDTIGAEVATLILWCAGLAFIRVMTGSCRCHPDFRNHTETGGGTQQAAFGSGREDPEPDGKDSLDEVLVSK